MHESVRFAEAAARERATGLTPEHTCPLGTGFVTEGCATGLALPPTVQGGPFIRDL